MEGKYLIITDGWFIAPDGKQYKGVWGNVQIVSDSILGIKTNTESSNWFAKVGSENNHVIIAGCQIHYACKSEDKPAQDTINDYVVDAGQVKEYNRPTMFYIAE